jgi:hypothetical protein
VRDRLKFLDYAPVFLKALKIGRRTGSADNRFAGSPGPVPRGVTKCILGPRPRTMASLNVGFSIWSET